MLNIHINTNAKINSIYFMLLFRMYRKDFLICYYLERNGQSGCILGQKLHISPSHTIM